MMTEPLALTMLSALERVCLHEGVEPDLITTTTGTSTYGDWTSHEIVMPNGRAVRVYNDDETVVIITTRDAVEVDRVTLATTLRLDSILGAIVSDEVAIWMEEL